MALLAVNSYPLAGQTRLVYHVSGQEMQPIAIDKDPKSCCAVERTSSGELKLANRCCGEIKTTPSHGPPRKSSPKGAFFGFYEHQFCDGKHPQKALTFYCRKYCSFTALAPFSEQNERTVAKSTSSNCAFLGVW
ncbi:MAG: hypothetical protein RLZ42_899 [Armatimonadota bacterium]